MTSQTRCPEPAGELLFESYLNQEGISAQREEDVGGRKPDFLVHAPGLTFAAEVYEPVIKRVASSSGAIPPPYEHYRNAFRGRKRKQINAVKKARMCYVAVLAGTAADHAIDPALMAGAMFGALRWSWNTGSDSDGGPCPGQMVFSSGAVLQPARMRGVSAVALIQSFNPTRRRLDEAIIEASGSRDDAWQRRIAALSDEDFENEIASWLSRAETIAAGLETEGILNREAEAVRLVVLHNPFAEYPLPPECLSGPYDEQWGPVSDVTAGYGPIMLGPAIREVPGRLAPERFETPIAARRQRPGAKA